MHLIVVEAGKLRGWEVFVTREKTTGLQLASEWKLLRGVDWLKSTFKGCNGA